MLAHIHGIASMQVIPPRNPAARQWRRLTHYGWFFTLECVISFSGFSFGPEGGERITERTKIVHDSSNSECECAYAKEYMDDHRVSYCSAYIAIERRKKNELANNHKKRQTNERRKKRAETRTHWTVQAVIYLISPAHIHCSLTLHHHLFHYCIARAICMLRFLFAMRNGIRSKSIFRCSFHSSAVSNSNFEIFFFSLFSCVCAWAFEPLPLSHSFVHLLYVYALKKSFFFCSSFTVFLSVSLSLHSI